MFFLKQIFVMGLNPELVQEQGSIVWIPPYTIHFTIQVTPSLSLVNGSEKLFVNLDSL